MKKLVSLALLISTNLYAKDVQFEKIWEKISTNSSSIKASKEEVEATKLNLNRSEKHWYPTIYMTGQSYITNDSGASMFGLLSQRKIEQTDFNPTSLNNPGASHFSKGAVGFNLPLYAFQYESKKSEDRKNELEFYSDISKNYFTLIALNLQKIELAKVSTSLESILSRYQIGNKGNMVGYSGLLGLKSLKNRLSAINDENKAKTIAYIKALNELSETNESYVFNGSENVQQLLKEYLPSTNSYLPSNKIKSFEYNALAASEVIGAEKSRNLPRVGVFAEGNVFNGKRDTATGYATGVYLNWNMFSGNDVGSTDIAIHNSHAAKYYAEAMSQKEKIEFNTNIILEDTLIKTLGTLEDSQKILDEQMIVSNSLFKNGMINALQLVEVLNRRIDLINSKTEVESRLIEAKAKIITLTNTKIEYVK
jgi:outer membrane protein TolC